jgi:hypothetical protein
MCYKRLPLGCLLKDETNNNIYLVIKSELKDNTNIIYYLCCIFDSEEDDQRAPFKYFFLINEERIEKFTVLNTRAIIKLDGTLLHQLDGLHGSYLDILLNNESFMVRYLTAVKKFTYNSHTFTVDGINRDKKEVCLERPASFLERIFCKAKILGFQVSWRDLLVNYRPLLDENINEIDFEKNIVNDCYFCKKTCDSK